jgi:hypothetical protein
MKHLRRHRSQLKSTTSCESQNPCLANASAQEMTLRRTRAHRPYRPVVFAASDQLFHDSRCILSTFSSVQVRVAATSFGRTLRGAQPDSFSTRIILESLGSPRKDAVSRLGSCAKRLLARVDVSCMAALENERSMCAAAIYRVERHSQHIDLGALHT